MSTPPVPYWDDLDWFRSLKTAIGRNLAYPSPMVMDALPEGEGVVGFDYHSGKLTDVVMVQSSGSQPLDAAIMKAVQSTTPPKVRGEYRDETHHFQLELELSPGIEAVRLLIYNRVTDNMKLPKSALPSKPVMVFVRADYLNGAFVSVDTDQPAAYTGLASDIVQRVMQSPLPDAPASFRDKHIRVDMQFCVTPDWKPCDFMQDSKWADFGGLTYTIPPD